MLIGLLVGIGVVLDIPTKVGISDSAMFSLANPMELREVSSSMILERQS